MNDVQRTAQEVAAVERQTDVSVLNGLAATVRREHAIVERLARTALPHAIAAGDALLAARPELSAKDWTVWAETTAGLPRSNAYRYMRLAFYRDHIAVGEEVGVLAALEGIKHLPQLSSDRSIGFPRASSGFRYPQEIVQRALDLYGDGCSRREVSEILGINEVTVWTWLEPKKAAESRRRRAARRNEVQRQERKAKQALEREEQRRLVVSHGSPELSRVYADLRKMVQRLDAVRVDFSDEPSRALGSAVTRLHQAEDQIIEAIKLAQAPRRRKAA